MRTDFQKWLQYAAWMVALLLVQRIAVPLISLWDVVPDLVLLGVLVIAVLEGQVPAMCFGFAAGLTYDLAVGEVVGLYALAKTVTGFFAGFWHTEEDARRMLRSPRFVALAAAATLLHNVLSLIAYFRSVDASVLRAFLQHGIGATLYTTVFCAVFVLILSRSGNRLQVSA